MSRKTIIYHVNGPIASICTNIPLGLHTAACHVYLIILCIFVSSGKHIRIFKHLVLLMHSYLFIYLLFIYIVTKYLFRPIDLFSF